MYENLLSDHNTCLRVVNVFLTVLPYSTDFGETGIRDPHTMLLSNLFMKMLAVKVILHCWSFEFCENLYRESHTFVIFIIGVNDYMCTVNESKVCLSKVFSVEVSTSTISAKISCFILNRAKIHIMYMRRVLYTFTGTVNISPKWFVS